MHLYRPQNKDGTVHLECNLCHLLNAGLLRCRAIGIGASTKHGNQITRCVWLCIRVSAHGATRCNFWSGVRRNMVKLNLHSFSLLFVCEFYAVLKELNIQHSAQVRE